LGNFGQFYGSACQCGLIDVTLHLRSPLGFPLQSFLYNFRW